MYPVVFASRSALAWSSDSLPDSSCWIRELEIKEQGSFQMTYPTLKALFPAPTDLLKSVSNALVDDQKLVEIL